MAGVAILATRANSPERVVRPDATHAGDAAHINTRGTDAEWPEDGSVGPLLLGGTAPTGFYRNTL